MPVTAALIGAAASAVPALVQLGTGAAQNYKAKKIARNNIRPEYVPNAQIQQNANLAASRANTGLSDASLALGTQQNERSLSQSLDAILRGGGSVNNISDLYAKNGDFMLKLAAMDNQLQNQNIQSFMNANKDVGQENQTAWSVNKYGPYADKAQLATTLRQNAMSNFSAGISGLSGAASNYLTANMYKNKPTTQPQGDSKYNYSNVYMNSQSRQNPQPDLMRSNYKDYPDTPYDRYLQSILREQDPFNDPTIMIG